MKKLNIIGFTLCIILVLLPTSHVLANIVKKETEIKYLTKQKKELIDKKIPNEVINYVNDEYKGIVEASIPYYTSLSSTNINDYTLGTPFVIYDSSKQGEEIYYVPVSLNQDIVLVISVINTTDGLTMSASDEYVDELNQIDYIINTDYIFFKEEEKLIALSPDNTYVLSKQTVDSAIQKKQSNVLEKSYLTQVKEISKNMDKRSIVNLNKLKEVSLNDNLTLSYTPGFSTSTNTSKVCALYNQKKQGNKPICWAATVATIVNYRKGSNHSAKDVCNKINVPYEGQTISVVNKALAAYGVNYSKLNSQLSWSKVMTNIDKKRPILVSLFAIEYNQGHAVTLYGYRTISVTDYIYFWEPQNGRTVTLVYKPKGSTYAFDNITWSWIGTLARVIN